MADPLSPGVLRQRGVGGSTGRQSAPNWNGGDVQQQPDSGHTPGTYSLSLLDPLGSSQKALPETGNFFAGLSNILFGQTEEDTQGSHGGLLGDVPVIGQGARFIGEVAGNAAGAVGGTLGGATDVLGGAMERGVFDSIFPTVGAQSAMDDEQLRKDFEALPEGPIKEEARRQMEANKAIEFGGVKLVGDADSHFMADAINKTREDVTAQGGKPGLWDNLTVREGTLMQHIENLMNVGFAIPQRGSERLLAGAGLGVLDGQSRFQEIMAVGRGEREFSTAIEGDHKAMTPVEQTVYDNVSSGKWGENEALDYLASHASGLSHDAATEMGLSMLTDPLFAASVVLSGGAAIGAKTAQLGINTAKTTRLLQSAEEALAVTRGLADPAVALARTPSGRFTAAAKRARAAIKELPAQEEAVREMRKGIANMGDTLATPGTNRLINPKKLYESERFTAAAKAVLGPTYVAAMGTNVGKTAKVLRTLIDPLHAVQRGTSASRALDMYSTEAAGAFTAAFGLVGDTKLRHALLAEDQAIFDRFEEAWTGATYITADRLAANTVRATAISSGAAASLVKDPQGPAGVLTKVVNNMPISAKDEILSEGNRLRRRSAQFDKAGRENLARRMAVGLGKGRDEAFWLNFFKKFKTDQLSQLHNATFVFFKGTLEKAQIALPKKGITGEIAEKAARLTVINRNTLTDAGAHGILLKLKAMANDGTTVASTVSYIQTQLTQYPELRNFVVDAARPERTIEKFTSYVESAIPRLPGQVLDDQLEAFRATGVFDDVLDQMDDTFTLGFKPDDRYAWSMERINSQAGGYGINGDPWTNTSVLGLPRYSPLHHVTTNILGQALPESTKLNKAVDYASVMQRMMRTRIGATTVIEAANAKMQNRLQERHGWTAEESNALTEALHEMTLAGDWVVNPRGFTEKQLWNGLTEFIPVRFRTGGNGVGQFTGRDLLATVLDGYDGDVRFIGVTQKFTGRVKSILGPVTGNAPALIAENVYPNLKFRLNVMFQGQERVEPGVLSAMRGVWSVGRRESATDQATQRLLDRITNTSTTRAADQELSELGSKITATIEQKAFDPDSKLASAKEHLETLVDVGGAKRLASIRTFRKGLGREVRAVWDQQSPGTWEDMKLHASIRQGRFLDDDDFAVHLMLEQQLSNEIIVPRALAFGKATQQGADFRAAVQLGRYMTPTTLGEVRSLGLDDVGEFMAFQMKNGRKTRTGQDIRRAINEGSLTIEQLKSTLLGHGFDPDYVNRVENSILFSWEGFWQQTQARFNLTPLESEQLQDMIGAAAELRNMTPVDYMSQVFSPTIQNGMDGAVGAMGGHVDIIRATAPGSDGLAYLAAKVDADTGAYLGTREDLVRQLSATFSHHLDPSAKLALLKEFRPELRAAIQRGDIKLDLADVAAAWDDLAESELAKRILGYMDGTPGTGSYDTVLDPALGHARARAQVDEYLASQGRTPRTAGRRRYRMNEVLHEQLTHDKEALPEVDYVVTGRVVKTKDLGSADTKLKTTKVDKRTRAATQDYVDENAAQFARFTSGDKPVKVTVVKEQPYATADELLADVNKGRLKVYGGDSDHPLLTNEQVVIARANQLYYGHAAEGFGFDPEDVVNATAHQAVMFSDTARSIHITERTDLLPGAPNVVQPSIKGYRKGTPAWDALPSSIDEYYAKYGHREVPGAKPLSPDDPVDPEAFVRHWPSIDPVTNRPVTTPINVEQEFGVGFQQLPFEQQEEIIKLLSWFRESFPDSTPLHVDVVPMALPHTKGGVNSNAIAATWGENWNEPVILFDKGHLGDDYEIAAERLRMSSEAGRTAEHFEHVPTDADITQASLDLSEAEKVYQAADDALTIWLETEGKKWPGITDEASYDSLAERIAMRKAEPNPEREAAVDEYLRLAEAKEEAEADMDLGMDFLTRLQRGKNNRQKVYMKRRSEQGVAWHANPGQRGTIAHERGHDLDMKLRHAASNAFTQQQRLDYHKWVQKFETSPAAKRLSEYGTENTEEMMAELYSVAFDAEFDFATLHPDIKAAVIDLRKFLEDSGIFRGKATVEGNVARKKRIGILPQESLDEFHATYIGNGRHAEANPDVARAAQMFSKWTQRVVGKGHIEGGGLNSQLDGILNDIAGMPTEAAVPYNLTEQRLVQAAEDAMNEKWEDTHRLQYFKRHRTMFERSINHPMFGIYPASYMWGKMLPEMARFVALEPFGVKTGAAAYAMLDVQKAMAIQREFDPELDARIEKVGHSQAMWMLNYMLPAVPWDISSALPSWLRDVSQQGLDNQANMAAGKDVEGLDILKPAQKVADMFSPFRPLKQVGSVAREFEEDAESQARALAQDPHSANDLGESLTEVMRSLQEALR